MKKEFLNMVLKPDTPKVGLGVIIFNLEGKFLLGERQGSHGAGYYSLPGGHMELGETFLDTAAREVMEETGLRIEAVVKVGFTNDIFETEGLHYVTLFLRAIWDGKQKPKNLEPDKVKAWEWHDVNDLPKNTWDPIVYMVEEIERAQHEFFYEMRDRKIQKGTKRFLDDLSKAEKVGRSCKLQFD